MHSMLNMMTLQCTYTFVLAPESCLIPVADVAHLTCYSFGPLTKRQTVGVKITTSNFANLTPF